MAAARSGSASRLVRIGGAALALALLSGCALTETQQHGYVLEEGAIEQIPIGSSREYVQLALGTPSTTSTIGSETFYYISQTTQRAAFLRPRVVDQRVLAVYFDQNGQVRDIGNYGLVNGRVFDFVDRVTPTGGQELTIIAQLLGAAARPSLGG